MQLVPADHVTEEDKAIQRILEEHPELKWNLALLLNGYRELGHMCMESMQNGETDTVDVIRSFAKKDTIAKRLGIPLFETIQDWEAAGKTLQAL